MPICRTLNIFFFGKERGQGSKGLFGFAGFLTWAHFNGPEKHFAVRIRKVINLSISHLTCSILPFRNLYEHGRMVHSQN